MNAASDVLSGSRPEAISPRRIPPARRLYWSVQREIWENRAVYLAPLAVAAVFLIGFLVSLVGLPARVRAASALGPMRLHEVVQQPYLFVALLLMAIDLILAVFYCLDALYGERRDRSILFWKSLPVSDLTTVLSKASIPILVLPLVTFAVTVGTQLVMLLASSAALSGSGMSAAIPWIHVPFLDVSMKNFVHLVAFHGVWYAPFYGWLLLVSAWSKRSPFLWATVPPVAIGFAERIAFGTAHFAAMLQYRFAGEMQISTTGSGMTMDILARDTLGLLLTRPGMWIGLAVTAAFLFAAVALRHNRGPI